MRVNVRSFLVVIACLLFSKPVLFAQSYSYTNEPLLQIITDIEKRTEYRFLYREALISDIKVSIEANESSFLARLSEELKPNNIGLKIDEDRKQALIYRSSEKDAVKTIRVNGFVVDSGTGDRLPYSTISWRDDGELKGVASNPSGSFDIITNSDASELSFIVSYVGYKPQSFALSFDEQTLWKDISIRMEPEELGGKEIVIRGVNFYTISDTVLDGMVKVGAFSPLGESNAVRSLQMLPSVSLNNAISDGINIRGSSSDGFQVLLDGQVMYHQSHLFGLLDAMNPDVLKTSGFYYDITPAQFQAPLGGTLSLITKTASLNEIRGSAGFSNTAGNATLEVPLIKGTSSLLVSGRLSYLDQINWLNNQGLVEFGLDVNRPADVVLNQPPPQSGPNFIQSISLNTIEVDNTEAQFYDVHSKFYYETTNGSQFSISGYLGHDDASQDYFRSVADVPVQYTTTNFWDTKTISANFSTRLSETTFSESSIGLSNYESQYTKDDFEFQFRQDEAGPNRDSSITAQLSLENSLTEFTAHQSFYTTFEGFSMKYGIKYSDFDVEYAEISLLRNSFRNRRTSQLVDLYHQVDITGIDQMNINLGNRFHYFSNGQYLRWSPRAKVQFFPESMVSAGLGFSRNYQFMHQLQFYNINSSDFWVLTNEDQPPSAVNYYTASVQFRPADMLYLQVEGYYKAFENLRFHELNTGLASNSFRNDESPWFYENDGIGKGIEVLMKNRFNKISFTSAYTLSSIRLRNDRINNGEYFYADWDRRHQFSLVSEISMFTGFNAYVSYTYGTGSPNRFDLQRFQETPRLPDYSRVDLTFSYSVQINDGSLKASVSVYNLTDNRNPWYAERKPVTIETRNRELRASAMTNVFDLGVQPSFSIAYYF